MRYGNLLTIFFFGLILVCYDKKVLPPHLPDHNVKHKFDVVEIPDLAGGLPVHREHRCLGCKAKPIIGYRFFCLECANLDLCKFPICSHLPPGWVLTFYFFKAKSASSWPRSLVNTDAHMQWI